LLDLWTEIQGLPDWELLYSDGWHLYAQDCAGFKWMADQVELAVLAGTPECADGIDNDGDGLVDYPNDPECVTASGASEAQCGDGIDNDGDGFADLDDPSCAALTDPYEKNPALACDDGIDNDGDGFTDFDDPNCSQAWPYWEHPPPACGLGAGLALVMPLALAMRRRWRAR
jgi:hypothetical protein